VTWVEQAQTLPGRVEKIERKEGENKKGIFLTSNSSLKFHKCLSGNNSKK
jgi:hypothetical protein